MDRMTFEDFQAYILENIDNFLPPEFKDGDKVIEEIASAKGVYTGLRIMPKEGAIRISPVIDLTTMYMSDYVLNEKNLVAEIMPKIADIYMHAPRPNMAMDPSKFIKMLKDFNACKDLIFPKVINKARNIEYISDKPHLDFEDLTVMFAVKLPGDDKRGWSSVPITETLLDAWGIDQKTLEQTTLANIEKNFEVNTLEGVITGLKPVSDVDELNTESVLGVPPIYVITSQAGMFGANIMYMALQQKDSLLDDVNDLAGDFYIIPSSVHELLLIPQDFGDPSDLIEIVKNINATEVSLEDFLSNSIYEYDSLSKEIAKVNIGFGAEDSF